MLKQERRRVAEAETVLREKGAVVEWSTSRRPLSPITGRTSPLHLDGGHSIGGPEQLGDGESVRTRNKPHSHEHDTGTSLTSHSASTREDTPPSSGIMAAKRAALRAGTVICPQTLYTHRNVYSYVSGCMLD